MRRLIIVISILWLLHIYIGFQLLSTSTPSATIIGIAIILLCIFAITIPISFRAQLIIRNPKLSTIISWLGLINLGLFSSLLVLTFLRQIILTLFSLYTPISVNMLNYSSILVVTLAAMATIIGFSGARRIAKVVEIDIPITNLPTQLNGFRIVQITDIHIGPTIKFNYLQAIVNVVNELGADIVAITGDLVDGSVEELSQHVKALTDLKSNYGQLFVLGNHEYYSGAQEWIDELKALGLTVLLNQHVVVKHNDVELVIAGITDYSGYKFSKDHASDPKAALLNSPQDSIKILLAHQPRSALEAHKYGFDLQISGHTHGGQFWPWNLFVRLQQPFTAGLGKINNMWVYTSRGTGYWGPPKRLGSPSEISLLRLIKA